MTDDGSVPGDDGDGNFVDDLVEELRRLNPVDVETLPPSDSPDALRKLEQILDRSGGSEPEPEPEAEPGSEPEPEPEAEPGSEPEPEPEVEAEADESSPSPAADGRGGGEAPPPCPTPR